MTITLANFGAKGFYNIGPWTKSKAFGVVVGLDVEEFSDVSANGAWM